MPFQTIITNGFAIGTVEFLKTYSREEYVGKAIGPFSLYEGRINSIKGTDTLDFEKYSISSPFTGEDHLTMGEKMREFVHVVLKIPKEERLEGKFIKTYYKGKSLEGITRLTWEIEQ